MSVVSVAKCAPEENQANRETVDVLLVAPATRTS